MTHLNPANNRLVARRLDDHTLGAFTDDYVREYITHGYALTVHSAQGATADTFHAILGENSSRTVAYVGLTRGRDTNDAYLYSHSGRRQHRRECRERDHVTDRGNSRRAAQLLRGVIANDQHPVTAHSIAVVNTPQSCSGRLSTAIERRARAIRSRSIVYSRWRAAAVASDHTTRVARSRAIGKGRSASEELEF